MTRQEFDNIGDGWYKRTHALRAILENQNETPERHEKALDLFYKMVIRMIRVQKMYQRINTVNQTDLPIGGYTGNTQ